MAKLLTLTLGQQCDRLVLLKLNLLLMMMGMVMMMMMEVSSTSCGKN